MHENHHHNRPLIRRLIVSVEKRWPPPSLPASQTGINSWTADRKEEKGGKNRHTGGHFPLAWADHIQLATHEKEEQQPHLHIRIKAPHRVRVDPIKECDGGPSCRRASRRFFFFVYRFEQTVQSNATFSGRHRRWLADGVVVDGPTFLRPICEVDRVPGGTPNDRTGGWRSVFVSLWIAGKHDSRCMIVCRI